MSRTAVASFKIICLLYTASLVGLAANIQTVKADYAWAKTIYIRADGSVEPSAAPILTADNVTYTLTDNIVGNVTAGSSAISVQRDNIVVDGAGYTLQSTEASNSEGMDLTGRSNVTIKNMKIMAFSQGILLSSSNNNTLSGNSITANKGDGVGLYSSSNNSIVGNMFAGCGLHTVESHGNEVEGNTVNGRPLVYLESISDYAVEDAGQVILVNCNNIQVENLNLSNVTIGIELWKTSNTKITNNNITANHWYGILLLSSDYNSVSGNNIADNELGIWLISSSSNVISGNNITANDKYGIALSDSPNTTLTSNILADNKYNLVIFGSWLPDFLNYVDESNSVDNKPVYYWVNLRNMTVPLDAGYVALVNCTHIAVQDLNLTNNGIGILLAFTTNSTITKTNVANNGVGISLVSSSNNDIYQNNLASNEFGITLIGSSGNSIYENNVTNCSHGIELNGCGSNSISGNNIADNEFGIYLVYTSNENVFGNNVVDNGVGISLIFAKNDMTFHNNFISNGQQATEFYWESWGNVWDDGYPNGGNYWSDYNGTDLNSGPYQNETGYDWIGDSPYSIDQHNTDKYPLMHPFESGTQEIEVAYRNLLGYYNNLLANFNTLNASYQQHLLNYTALQTKYGDLQEGFNSLNTSYLSLNSSYQALNASYNNLNTSFTDYHQTTQNELANIKNTLYVFIAVTVVLAAALAFVATRKSKTKPET
jgi:parallel beta-helix repeat protein